MKKRIWLGVGGLPVGTLMLVALMLRLCRSVTDMTTEPAGEIAVREVMEAARREHRKVIEGAEERFNALKGKPAPELEVGPWLYGKPITLPELKGQVVVLHFWPHWSQIAEAIKVQRSINVLVLQREYEKRGVIFIGIHEFIDQVDELKKIIEEKDVSYRVAVDKKSSVLGAKGVTFDKYSASEFAVIGFHRFIIIDRQGLIWDGVLDSIFQAKIALGDFNLEAEIPHLEAKIQELLSK